MFLFHLLEVDFSQAYRGKERTLGETFNDNKILIIDNWWRRSYLDDPADLMSGGGETSCLAALEVNRLSEPLSAVMSRCNPGIDGKLFPLRLLTLQSG